jgi:hypothetical protein
MEFAQALWTWEDYLDKHGDPNDDWRAMRRDAHRDDFTRAIDWLFT